MPGIRPPLLPVPGFAWLGRNVGIKDDSADFAVLAADRPCQAAAVFTRNNFPGAPLVVGRAHVADGRLQAVAVNSKNANVATGDRGVEHARAVCRALGDALGIDPALVLPSSTGVIGVELPVQRLLDACPQVPAALEASPEAIERFARAIMTTDTRPKACSVRAGGATVTGVAKGAGMIEPHMATMLAFFATDAEIPHDRLRPMLQRVCDRSFNRVSVDGDTSTSDTVAVLANGRAGAVDGAALEAGLLEAAQYLAREIARDGEGATRLIEVTVAEAPGAAAALAIAKSVINSPLVKTAIYGADPNWGRLIMAIGKVFDHPVPLEGIRIAFGTGEEGLELTPEAPPPQRLQAIADYLRRDEVRLTIRLGSGTFAETVWGCDLTEGYVKENAYYTT